MTLSSRAEKLISLGNRVDRPTGREEIARFLASANITQAEPFLRFQETYGGLQLFAAGMQDAVELSLLLDPGDGNYQMAAVEDEGEWMVAVGRFQSSENLLMMDEDGIVYADTIPIADSIEKWLESHAVAAEMQLDQPDWYGTAFMTVHREARGFDALLDSAAEYPRIEEACDDYTLWWGNADVRFERTVVWDPDNKTHAIRGFARTGDFVPAILAVFESACGVQPPILWWPYRIEDGQPARPGVGGTYI